MKKFLLAALVLCLGFVGCDKDDNSENSKESIVGKWYMVNDKGYYHDTDGERVDYDDSYTKDNTQLYWEFFSDKTAIGTDLEDQDEPVYMNVTWKINGDKLIMNNNTAQSVTIKSLTATTLVTYESGIDEDGKWEGTSTFKKFE